MNKPSMLAPLLRFLARPVIQTGIIVALAGIAFSGANLVFAWVLSPREYGLLTLLIALMHLGKGIGALGLNGVVIRRSVRIDFQLLNYGVVASILCAVLLALFGRAVYGIASPLLAIISVGVIAGSLAQLAAAQFQVEHRFVLAIVLTQISNFGLALASLAFLIFADVSTPMLPLSLAAVATLVAATWGWQALLRKTDYRLPPVEPADFLQAALVAGVAAAWEVGLQLERMVIPKLFSLDQLAVFGLLAAFVVAPFRCLELATASTLMPRLRVADIYDRRRILMQELVFVAALSSGGGVLICAGVPFVVDWLYGEKFDVSVWLILAATTVSALKVAATFGRTAALALCTSSELGMLNLLTWAMLGMSLVGAVIGARWGLTGAIYGIGTGFLVVFCWTLRLARPHYTVRAAGLESAA